jgi:cytochrome c peroxidase
VRDARSVSQRNKTFWPDSIVARRGERITILNDDTRTHNLRIVDRLWNFNSGSQEPGESVMLKLDHAGRFVAHCGIHPTMRLTIEVE